MISIWYKNLMDNEWTKYGDYNDFNKMISDLNALKTALGKGYLVKYF